MLTLPGLAIRNIARTPRRSGLVSLAVIGGCAALVFMLSMNNGLAEMMITNSVGLMLGHAQIDNASGATTAEAEPALSVALATAGVTGAAPRLDLPVLMTRAAAQGGAGRADGAPKPSVHGALVMGIDAAREHGASTFPDLVTSGHLPASGEGAAVALGDVLARALGAGIGDELGVSYLDRPDHIAAGTLRVVGIFRAGSEELDGRLALAPIDEVRRLVGAAGAASTRIVVRARSNGEAAAVAGSLRAALPSSYRVRTWGQVSPFLQAMVNFQHGSANVVLFFMYMVVGAGVAAIQLMSILERTRELGVLASIGFSPGRVVALVATETMILGALAVTVGLSLGFAWVSLVARAGGFDVRIAGGAGLEGLMGMDPHLVPVFSSRVLAYTAGLVGPVLVLGGVLPGLRAARMTPMEALRRA
jgi:ABC-type lipoprotein release transport system permease subunit